MAPEVAPFEDFDGIQRGLFVPTHRAIPPRAAVALTLRYFRHRIALMTHCAWTAHADSSPFPGVGLRVDESSRPAFWHLLHAIPLGPSVFFPG